ncbi:patatin-like phospholipase family protein [Corynebacterium heidelbergense]|uniref:Patatin family protein n=1 Tax=Corynebacterium heidelbergense TaxID=2055947 RepID=A0A364V4G5_9CORY|nr:patatin family protein [Corynebacterium heidelbergense]RAV31511.1 patatin family protein [Corynebacterium heidelbergense]
MVQTSSPEPNVTRTALIFEGGAMRAVYSAAMVEALIEANVNFSFVCGNSASTAHVANYVSRDIRRMRHAFTEFPSHPEFGGWGTYLRGQGFFNADYIYDQAHLPDHPLAMDWETFAASPVNYRISAFEGVTGETVHWGREHIHSAQDYLLRARASSTLPVIMSPVHIDGQTWFDGAFGPTGGIPLDSAEQEGFDRFVFVMTRTRGYRKGSARSGWYLRRALAKYPALVESFITRHTRYNETRERIFQMEREGSAYVWAPERISITNGNRRTRPLMRAYEAGLAQARREMPRIREFLGLDPLVP